MDNKRVIGPNLQKLIILKMSQEAIPNGGGLVDGLKFLSTPGALSSGWQAASEWCDKAIEVVRGAADPNPWKMSSKEDIAGELLRRIALRKN